MQWCCTQPWSIIPMVQLDMLLNPQQRGLNGTAHIQVLSPGTRVVMRSIDDRHLHEIPDPSCLALSALSAHGRRCRTEGRRDLGVVVAASRHVAFQLRHVGTGCSLTTWAPDGEISTLRAPACRCHTSIGSNDRHVTLTFDDMALSRPRTVCWI